MQRVFALIAAIALPVALTACGGPILGPGTLEDKLAVGADYTNTYGTEQMRRQIGPSFGKASVSARVDNADTLVVMIEGLPSGNATWDPNVMRKRLRPEMCSEPVYHELFGAGGKVRLEVISNIGRELPAVKVSSC
jgi:hypothetical protein